MTIREYRRLPSMGISRETAYEASNLERVINRLLSGCFIIVCLLALLFIYDWMLERDMSDAKLKIDYHKAEEDKAIKALATCFNGGVVKVGDIAVFCDRAVEQQGL